MKNNDRLKYRAPVLEDNGEFIDFHYFNAIEGANYKQIGPYKHGKEEQCTGLKDMEGNLVYEGDIIELYRGKSNIHQKKGKRFEVKFLTHRFCGFGFGYVDCPSVDMALTESKAKICKVIGNIHENPELLEN